MAPATEPGQHRDMFDRVASPNPTATPNPATAPRPTVPHVRAGVATSAGNRRTANQDAHHAGPTWFVVADGMGGHRHGDVAAAITVGTFAADAAERAALGSAPRVGDVERLVATAHDRVGAAARGVAMGATLVGAVLVHHDRRPAVAVFHVGDARCYHLTGGRLTQLTTDHTHVQELVDAGRLRPGEVRTHPLRNVVTRAIGIEPGGGPDIVLLPPDRGRLLLCSDGLTGELDPHMIGRVLVGIADPGAAARRLVDLVLTGPARDNVTAMVVDVDAAAGGSVAGQQLDPVGRRK